MVVEPNLNMQVERFPTQISCFGGARYLFLVLVGISSGAGSSTGRKSNPSVYERRAILKALIMNKDLP